jgi:hypothetical protein
MISCLTGLHQPVAEIVPNSQPRLNRAYLLGILHDFSWDAKSLNQAYFAGGDSGNLETFKDFPTLRVTFRVTSSHTAAPLRRCGFQRGHDGSSSATTPE